MAVAALRSSLAAVVVEVAADLSGKFALFTAEFGLITRTCALGRTSHDCNAALDSDAPEDFTVFWRDCNGVKELLSFRVPGKQGGVDLGVLSAATLVVTIILVVDSPLGSPTNSSSSSSCSGCSSPPPPPPPSGPLAASWASSCSRLRQDNFTLGEGVYNNVHGNLVNHTIHNHLYSSKKRYRAAIQGELHLFWKAALSLI
ncbi:hypothetical protein R3P38DRAFT_2810605 [Favolaschia claudopus]|uniref:Uncharacterized protein n=1 Tax=Favolaschia claudopus TaxID=2862362 RepID=A0AAV9ZBM1_9AGAR